MSPQSEKLGEVVIYSSAGTIGNFTDVFTSYSEASGILKFSITNKGATSVDFLPKITFMEVNE